MKKFLTLMLAVLMVVTSVLTFAACTKDGDDAPAGNDSKVIGVVAKGESHAFWQSVKAGAEAAAKEKGYTITFRGPASESPKDIPSQQEMVQTALSNNVAGLVRGVWVSFSLPSVKALPICSHRQRTRVFP